MEYKIYNNRFLARIVLEACTPMLIGSGNKSVKTDSLINRDVNGLPFIPGTTIAGLLRHAVSDDVAKRIFGYQRGDEGKGAKLIFTEAKMTDANSVPVDGLLDKSNLEDGNKAFLESYFVLPIRQHVRIGHGGTAEENGKFDEEVIPRGTRFCFEMEMVSEDKDEEKLFKDVIAELCSQTFRVGGKSRSGYGRVKVVSCLYRALDISKAGDMEAYLSKSSSLSETWKGYEEYKVEESKDEGWIEYRMELKPVDFMFFGSGFGNDDADKTFVREHYVSWNDGQARINELEKCILIPGSSVKGALAHRVAYHFNRLTGVYADELKTEDDFKSHLGKSNKAVCALFGSEGIKERHSVIDKKRGNVLVPDVVQLANDSDVEKVMNHVKIDRFLGGAVDGALFSEEVLYAGDETITISLMVDKVAFSGSDSEKIQEAFETALTDVCKGRLPLGGNVNKGYGCFNGKLIKDEEVIYE